jgi:hypothetical protein
MGTVILKDTVQLNTIKLSELPQAIGAGGTDILPIVKDNKTQQIEKDSYLANSRFGDGTNYSYFEADGKLHFVGTARPVIFKVIDSSMAKASYHNLLGITSLSAVDGITVEGLDENPSISRRIEVLSIGCGAHVKGRLANHFSIRNTTDSGSYTQIILSTTNTVWDQVGEWRLVLEIVAGTVTGTFTIIMPAFTLLAYGRFEFHVTTEGAVYFIYGQNGYYSSLSGPNAASEVFLNDKVAGSDVVIEVADTTGFYSGHEVFVSDSENEEWVRIKAITLNTSITVDALSNSYNIIDGAKLDIFDFTRTPVNQPIMRGLYSCHIFKANENMGVQFQFGIPQSVDSSSDIFITFQYLASEDNAGAEKTKWQLQYVLKRLGEDIPESIQYATRIVTLITPPTTKGNSIHVVGTVPAAEHAGKHAAAIKLVRVGRDAEDTYTGDIKYIALVVGITHKQLGYET